MVLQPFRLVPWLVPSVTFAIGAGSLMAVAPSYAADETIEVTCFQQRGEWYVPAVQVFSRFSCRVWWKPRYAGVAIRRAVRGEQAGSSGAYEWTAREIWATRWSAGPGMGPGVQYGSDDLPPEAAEVLWSAFINRDGTGFVPLRRVCEKLGLDLESAGFSGAPPWTISGYVNRESDVGEWVVGETRQGGQGTFVSVRLVRRGAVPGGPPLPPPPEAPEVPGLSAIPAPGLGFPVVTVTNNTKYTLYLYLKGPEQYSWRMAPGESVSETIEPGRYKYFATVKRSYVVPASGYHRFEEDTRYEWSFYIR